MQRYEKKELILIFEVVAVILHKKLFPELTVEELYELLRVRSEVFGVEQDCVYQDLDGDDQASVHLWLTEEDKVVALCRVCPAGTHMREVSIGRVITTERGKGYGKQIMREVLPQPRNTLGRRSSTSKLRNTRKASTNRWGSASPPSLSSSTASHTSR